VKLSIGRLEVREGRKRFKMVAETGIDYLFKNLGYKIQIGYWTIAGEIIFWECLLFQQWRNNGMFEGSRKNAFRE